MMDTIETDEIRDAKDIDRRGVIQMKIEKEDIARHEQTIPVADGILMSLSPLINSMRPFGLYFTRKPRVGPATSSQRRRKVIISCRSWNLSRIYATIMLVVMWLNTVRYCFVFDGSETLGADLFAKMGKIPGNLLTAVLHTSYYVASHTGSLDRILRQVNVFTSDFSAKYSRRAKVLTVICWILTAFGMFYYVYSVFLRRQFHYSLLLIIKTFHLSIHYADIIGIVSLVLQLQFVASWAFAQAMNFIVVSFLYDQFNQLLEEFSKCIGDRGEFNGEFGHFRRRHQAISRAVQEADRFLMFSYAAYFSCQIAIIIFVFYSTIFYREVTVLLHADFAVVYIVWLSISVFGLSLTAGQAIILNNMVSTVAIMPRLYQRNKTVFCSKLVQLLLSDFLLVSGLTNEVRGKNRHAVRDVPNTLQTAYKSDIVVKHS